MYEAIKATAPNIPEEVIRLWLLPFAESKGWPPSEHGNWDRQISGESVEFWNDSDWEKVTTDLTKLPYSSMYFDAMEGLQEAYRDNVNNAFMQSLGANGKRRFGRCLTYILKNRKFPQPPVLLANELNEYQILDGNHRFYAYLVAEQTYAESLSISPEKQSELAKLLEVDAIQPPLAEQEVWVCRPKWENSEGARTRQYLRSQGWPV